MESRSPIEQVEDTPVTFKATGIGEQVANAIVALKVTQKYFPQQVDTHRLDTSTSIAILPNKVTPFIGADVINLCRPWVAATSTTSTTTDAAMLPYKIRLGAHPNSQFATTSNKLAPTPATAVRSTPDTATCDAAPSVSTTPIVPVA